MAELDPKSQAEAWLAQMQTDLQVNPSLDAVLHYQKHLRDLPLDVQEQVHKIQQARRPIRKTDSSAIVETQEALMKSGPINYELVKQNVLSAFPQLDPDAPVPSKEIINPNDPQRRATPYDYH